MSLSVSGLNKRFAGVVAVSELSFEAPTGLVTALIGPNGAGKTTALNLISGLMPADSGAVRLEETRISGLPAHRIARHGLARTYQNLQMFEDMSALEVVMVGQHMQARPSVIKTLFRLRVTDQELALEEKARALLIRVGVPEELIHRDARSLPYGLQRRVEIARALAGEPRVLLLDEPAAGLNPTETRQIAGYIRTLQGDGLTIVLIEHDMDMVMRISDRVVVMNFGTCIAQGSPAEVQRHPEVLRAYLGDWGSEHAAD